MSKKSPAGRKQSRQTQKKQASKSIINFEIPFSPNRNQKIMIYAGIFILALVLPIIYINYAVGVNGGFGFPLDDPWIHLTFAKNLAQYRSFSYFKDQMATAGSTSPIYTFLAAIAFIFTQNEMVLSYVLGISFLVLSALAFYRLSSFEFGKENIFAIVCAAIFVLDKWMNFISVSGMETTMYIFFLVACAYFYKKRHAIPFAIFLGLILWGRPDGVAFIGALVVDYFLVRYYSKSDSALTLFNKQELIKIAVIFGGIIVLYFIMNYILSGSLLPNTYNAKLTYYSPEFRSRGDFLHFEVWDYFTNGAYAVIMAGFIFSVLKLLFDFTKKKYNTNFLYILFIFALVFIYWYKLPYAHRFGRYMMPIIPFFILVSTLGIRDLGRLIGSFMKSKEIGNGIVFISLAVILFMGYGNYNDNKENYAIENKYISDRQVAAAMWLKEHTKDGDVIGTHDVGAIGFYSGRKIVDVAGLVTPELINKINDNDYVTYMEDYMKQQGVTHLAFLREWYTVVNQTPLFTTGSTLPPEVMEIYAYIPDSTLIVSKEVKSMLLYAREMLAQKAPQQAIQVLLQAVQKEPRSSYTYFLLGYAYSMMNDPNGFESNMQKAVEYFPDYTDALLNLGNLYLSRQDYSNAKTLLERAKNTAPDNPKVLELYNKLPDSLKAGG
ncbi:MAG: tetratricopeptide repeat protein [Ignavibacteriae bacterium]|nr:tetratricopeptide repeat protein [Ignavibacteriota bacterium]MCB9242082.1 tetratricopeptide repeat protein [Ignavibacteriales bacterium]